MNRVKQWLRRLLIRLASRLDSELEAPLLIPNGVKATITISYGVIVRGKIADVEKDGHLTLILGENAVSVLLRCPCGQEHSGPAWDLALGLVLRHGETIPVQVMGSPRRWLVPRVYIAMHGLVAADIPALAERYGWSHEPDTTEETP